jgi:hypothetical protein
MVERLPSSCRRQTVDRIAKPRWSRDPSMLWRVAGCDSRPVTIPAPALAPGLHYRQRWLPGLKRGHGSLRMARQHSTSRSRSENSAEPMYN